MSVVDVQSVRVPDRRGEESPVGRAAVAGGAAPALVDLKADGRRRQRHLRVPRLAVRIVGPLLALGLWQLLCNVGVFTQDTIPSPASVVRAGQQLLASGQLQSNFVISLERVG